MRKPLTLSKPGLSLVDANKGRLITYQDDVLGIKRQIEQMWPGVLSVFFDEYSEEWVIVEHCADGTDRVCFKTVTLSQGTIDRLQRADQALGHNHDPLKEIEREEAQLERDKDHSLSEAIGEASERLFLALRRDGVIHAPKVYMTNSGTRMRNVS